ncbi:hypothetical protein Pmani_036199 [Petrolisthes manimaculis]|uniref:Uncharacterized protein n=1 Tax=Petrolisthes manimaculis TaxID=1843537 RepID=A0AAE1NIX3_9EUCA|nr:hypothetical protein Pmani_036199 [Petrolisthes manimaculis]
MGVWEERLVEESWRGRRDWLRHGDLGGEVGEGKEAWEERLTLHSLTSLPQAPSYNQEEAGERTSYVCVGDFVLVLPLAGDGRGKAGAGKVRVERDGRGKAGVGKI